MVPRRDGSERSRSLQQEEEEKGKEGKEREEREKEVDSLTDNTTETGGNIHKKKH